MKYKIAFIIIQGEKLNLKYWLQHNWVLTGGLASILASDWLTSSSASKLHQFSQPGPKSCSVQLEAKNVRSFYRAYSYIYNQLPNIFIKSLPAPWSPVMASCSLYTPGAKESLLIPTQELNNLLVFERIDAEVRKLCHSNMCRIKFVEGRLGQGDPLAHKQHKERKTLCYIQVPCM